MPRKLPDPVESRELPGDFGDIRCFDSREIPGAFERLVYDRQAQRSMSTLVASSLRLPWLGDTGPLRWLLRAYARWHFRGVASVNDFCARCSPPVERLFRLSIQGLSASGLDNLRERSLLLVSNHRDIVLDALIANRFMVQKTGVSARVAIGTNLESLPPWVVHLMRMIGCFFVPRGEPASRRERYKKLVELSQYIRRLLSQGDCVWIAQREGRALDGVDATEIAVLKMLGLHSPRAPLSEALQGVGVVPVSVSYEWDPCDLHKARRVALDERVSYTREVEDGVLKPKGGVHIHFGAPVGLDGLEDATELSAELDRQIRDGYRIWPSSYAARALLQSGGAVVGDLGEWSREQVDRALVALQERVAGQEEGVREAVLAAYAAPLLQRLLPAG